MNPATLQTLLDMVSAAGEGAFTLAIIYIMAELVTQLLVGIAVVYLCVSVINLFKKEMDR